MTPIILRLAGEFQDELWRHLLKSGRGVEETAFLFARYSESSDSRVFIPKDWYPVPPKGFAFSSAFHFELTDETRAFVIKRAHDLEASLIEVHSHDDPGPPAFSPSDLHGFEDFVPHVWWRLKGRPYLALVVAPGGIDGLAWVTAADKPERLGALQVEGRVIKPSHRSRFRWSDDLEW